MYADVCITARRLDVKHVLYAIEECNEWYALDALHLCMSMCGY